jgi:heptosyltransferase II
MKKILVIRFSSLGDVVISTAFFEACKKKYNDSKIFVLTKDSYSDVFFNNPNIEKIFTIGKKSLLDVCREINKEKVDLIFDLHRNIRSFITSFLIKGKVLRYNKDIYGRNSLVRNKKIKDFKYETTRERYINCLGYIDENIKNSFSKIYLKDSELENSKKDLRYDSKFKYIGINIGAKWNTKKWISRNYAELAMRLLDKKVKVIIIGSREDNNFKEQIFEYIKPEYKNSILDTVGKLNLREFFSIIKLCDVLITPDSAGLHIAQALGVRVIALFGPTVKEFGFWENRGQDFLIEKNILCRPCSLHGNDVCPEKHFKCMNEITVDEVWDVVRKLIINN